MFPPKIIDSSAVRSSTTNEAFTLRGVHHCYVVCYWCVFRSFITVNLQWNCELIHRFLKKIIRSINSIIVRAFKSHDSTTASTYGTTNYFFVCLNNFQVESSFQIALALPFLHARCLITSIRRGFECLTSFIINRNLTCFTFAPFS